MAKKELLIIADYSEESLLTLEELCGVCDIRIEVIRDFVSHDIVKPTGNAPEEWMFDVMQLQRLQKALRLQRDFELNLHGAALVLDLLDELEKIRAHITLLEKHYSKSGE